MYASVLSHVLSSVILLGQLSRIRRTTSLRSAKTLPLTFKVLQKAYAMERAKWNFDVLADNVSCFRQPTKRPAQDGPSLIVLCTWMSAHRKHIAKYTEQYRQQYPDAEILVIESTVGDLVYRSTDTQQQKLLPAREILLFHISDPIQGNEQGKVLLHAFSNGGAQSAVQLVAGLPPDARLKAFHAIVFDSCPGTATYRRTVHAMSLSMPKSLLWKILGPPILHIVLCLICFSLFVTGAEDVISRIRRQLNDHTLFSPEAARLYICSKTDELVPYQDVSSHAHDAKQNGYSQTQELVFEASGHCAHAMTHKYQYWEAVEKLLQSQRQILPN